MEISGSPRRAASQSVVTSERLDGGRVAAMVTPLLCGPAVLHNRDRRQTTGEDSRSAAFGAAGPRPHTGSDQGRLFRDHALYKRDPDPAVLLALLFDLGDADRADFGGRAHMGAAAGLQVEACNLDEPHPAGADRRL